MANRVFNAKLILTVLVALVALGFLAKLYVPSAAKPTVLYQYAAKDSGNDLNPAIAYGNGAWVAVWQSNDSLKPNTQPAKSFSILYSISADGKTWPMPKAIASSPVLNAANNTSPRVATDQMGTWLVGWESDADLGGIGTDSDLLQVISTNNAQNWLAPSALNLNAPFDNSKPAYTKDLSLRVATDGKGHWTATWFGDSWAKSSENPGCGETAPATIWKSGVYRVYVQYTEKLTSGWKRLYCIQPAPDAEHVYPDLATDGLGNWLVSFASGGPVQIPMPAYPCKSLPLGNDLDILYTQSDNKTLASGTGVWGTCYPGQVNDSAGSDSGTDSRPVIRSNGKVWIAVWQSSQEKLGDRATPKNLGKDYDILFATSKDGVTWSKAQSLNSNAETDSGHDHYPAVAVSGDEWVVVWESYDDLGVGLGADADILVATSTNNGAKWSAPRALHDTADSDSKADSKPQIATDGTDWVVVWHSYEDGGSGKDADILTARFTLPLP